MQLAILDGTYADPTSNFRTAHPRNLIPVPKAQGISQGYLRPAEGIVKFADGSGGDRGGINWNGVMYRVQGSNLISVEENGNTAIVGDVGLGGRCRFDYSFTHLAVSSGGRFYLYDGITLLQNTDPDLGVVVDFQYLSGYFFTTDGDSLVVTDINDPFSVTNTAYGSAEFDPDPVNGIQRVRKEAVAVNRYTIQFYRNVGGTLDFPFVNIAGAELLKGAVGTSASCVLDGQIAFVGGGRNEPPAVYLGSNGSTQKISTREIELILKEYTEDELALVSIEPRENDSHKWLYIKLPNKTIVFDVNATAALSKLIWFTLSAGVDEELAYPASGFVYCYDKWLAADPIDGTIGEMVDNVSTLYGDEIKWEFNIGITYNEGLGVIVHEQELVCLTGSSIFGKEPVVSMQHSTDGENWSIPLTTPAGVLGDRSVRVEWRRLGYFQQWQTMRFYGSSDSHISIARLDARFEGLAN